MTNMRLLSYIYGVLPTKRALLILIICQLVPWWGCTDRFAERLTYQVEGSEVVCTFTQEDIDNYHSGRGADLDDFKNLAIKKFQHIDSLQDVRADGWKLIKLDSSTYQLRRNISEMGTMQYQHKMLLTSHLQWGHDPDISGRQAFGYCAQPVRSIQQVGEKHRFHLYGYTDAHQVYLSGNFNDWNTLAEPMIKTDSGWVSDLDLPYGAYLYKFIVDGTWMADPSNANRVPNEFGQHNSLFVVPNHSFQLDAYTEAEEVYLAGEFTDWEDRKVPMQQTAVGWAIDVYLEEGTHQYKYMVDDQWVTDPTSSGHVSDEFGNLNSSLTLGTSHLFELQGHSSAKRVVVSGTFNRWNEHDLQMTYQQGKWVADQVLPSGNYEYKFIVDGKWITDPANPYIVPNEHDTDNSWLVVGKPETFRLDGFSTAKRVILSGTFVGWDEEKCQMVKKDDGWEFPIHLTSGKHAYKFVVDGLWMTDPGNTLHEVNRHSSFNSVIWK